MTHRISVLLAGAALLALAPGVAGATAIFGSLGNFDTVNDTGQEAHGFEIDLEGISVSNVTDTFGGGGRGFPSTVERYGAPTISAATFSDGSTGVKVIYQASYSGSGWSAVTPTGIYSTPGESCWTGGGIGYGPSTPCDHFGVGLSANPTKTTYSWLVGATPVAQAPVKSSVLAPTWSVTPQAGSPPVVAAQIVAPEPDPGNVWGKAIWVKVYTTEVSNQVGLYNLVGNDPVIQQAEANPPEIEWQLLQVESGVAGSGLLENGGAAAVGAGAESVIRKYEFFNYTGLYSAEGEATPFNGDTAPCILSASVNFCGDGVTSELGSFIGAQNAALNFAGAPAPFPSVPEPSTWAIMLTGLGGLGVALRSRRRAIASVAYRPTRSWDGAN